MMENEKLLCPLFLSSDQFNTTESRRCLEEKCAWWDENTQACSILSLAKAVRRISRNGR